MKRIILIATTLVLVLSASAQTRKLQNRPYIDERRIHYGFSFGFHMQDMEFTNNGYIDPATGEQWYADVDNYNPGFSVGVLAEMRLSRDFAFRVQPTMHFGQKHVRFHEQLSGRDTTQNIKSTYIAMHFDVKYTAQRFNNYRPYLVAGFTPMLDLTRKKQGTILPKAFDCYAEVGVGCDFYLRFFKLNPELKFCFGLSNILQKDRSALIDQNLKKFTESVDKARSKMIVLTFYFE